MNIDIKQPYSSIGGEPNESKTKMNPKKQLEKYLNPEAHKKIPLVELIHLGPLDMYSKYSKFVINVKMCFRGKCCCI